MNDLGTSAETTAQTASAREPVLKVVNGSKIYGGVHAI
jgi:hypothetical protein